MSECLRDPHPLMPKKSKSEIEAEISALEKLTPVGRFAHKTAATIQVQLEVLRNGGVVGLTCDEWNDLTEEQQTTAYDVQNWVDGSNSTRPSADWGGLVK